MNGSIGFFVGVLMLGIGLCGLQNTPKALWIVGLGAALLVLVWGVRGGRHQ